MDCNKHLANTGCCGNTGCKCFAGRKHLLIHAWDISCLLIASGKKWYKLL